MRRTLSDATTSTISRIPVGMNLTDTDSRVITHLNLAVEMLLTLGHWWDTVQTYEVLVSNNIFALPPQFATMEGVTVNRNPRAIRTRWYQYLRSGPGLLKASGSRVPPANAFTSILTDDIIPLGNAPTFADIANNGNAHQVRLQCDVAADIGEQVLVLGWDNASPPNWIRSQVSGVWQDGELITLAQTPGTLSVHNFSQVTGIQKPVTSGQVWLYDYDTVLATNTLIGQYQYWETRPYYPRYQIPVLPITPPSTVNPSIINIIGKMAYIPVANPTDWLIISNLNALRMGCLWSQAIERRDFASATLYLNGGTDKQGNRIIGAREILDAELAHYTASSETANLQIVNADDDYPVAEVW